MPHGMHARLPRNFVLEERLERYARAIELAPQDWRGRWAAACAPLDAAPYREVRLDLGCGKGAFAVESARREPDVLFVAMDSEPICVAYAAQRVCESGLPNVIVVPGTGMRVREFFSPGELSCIYLNFPTPFPRKREIIALIRDMLLGSGHGPLPEDDIQQLASDLSGLGLCEARRLIFA